MSEILDASGRPQIANAEPIFLKFYEEGFQFPIPPVAREQLHQMALVANDGHVPDLPVGTPVWENDPLVTFVVFEIHAGFEEMKGELKDVRTETEKAMQEHVEALTRRMEALEQEMKEDRYELAQLREKLEAANV